MTTDLQLAAEYAAKAAEQRSGGSEQRGESAGGDSPKVLGLSINPDCL